MISVCLVSYNGAKYIRQQIDSILAQLDIADELIISDDGSTDDTIAIIESYDDSRIHLIFHQEDHGYTKNFEYALSQAKGDYIFLSDQDDVWLENKVAICLEVLQKYDLVIHDAIVTDGQLQVKYPSHFEKYQVVGGFWKTVLRTRYTGACMAMTKRFKEYALPFPKYQKYCPHDYWLSYLGYFTHRVKIIDQGLILYRRHDHNVLTAGEYSTRSLWEKIMTRIYCLTHMIMRGGFK